jgi:hypothetical protein
MEKFFLKQGILDREEAKLCVLLFRNNTMIPNVVRTFMMLFV